MNLQENRLARIKRNRLARIFFIPRVLPYVINIGCNLSCISSKIDSVSMKEKYNERITVILIILLLNYFSSVTTVIKFNNKIVSTWLSYSTISGLFNYFQFNILIFIIVV